jgi:hypothetical protein
MQLSGGQCHWFDGFLFTMKRCFRGLSDVTVLGDSAESFTTAALL